MLCRGCSPLARSLCDRRQVAFLLWASVQNQRVAQCVDGKWRRQRRRWGEAGVVIEGKGSGPLHFVRVLWPLDTRAIGCLLSQEGPPCAPGSRYPGRQMAADWQAQGREEPARPTGPLT